MLSDLVYTVCLIGYMQAIPTKLVAISTVVNALILAAKLIWRF